MKTKESYCPVCNKLIDGATTVDGNTKSPKSGDLIICFYCTSYLIFDDELIPQELTVEELLDLDNADRLRLHKARKDIKNFWGKAK